ncbi:putative F-box protein At3g16210 [Medicago truncatula]|uniref:putative F-box protein At3g16210 n=1 Tax=Medicago truncatula TaxID=3880 RepID=UPI000D2F4210|nr:putative F-box protein At3g16210 [Medicago truncatula]
MAPNNEKVSSSLYIPEDVSFIIFSKLSLKSLKRFTCACKSWSLLFENPSFMNMFRKNFISMHQSLYNNTYLFLNIKEIWPCPQDDGSELYLVSGDKFENSFELKWPDSLPLDADEIYLFDSGFNDIICFSDIRHARVALWNLDTKQLETVARSPAQVLPSSTPWFVVHGCGYDHVNDDYKIIRYVHTYNYIPYDKVDWTYMPMKPHPFWEIYSIRNHSWKRLDLDDMARGTGRKVYLNGLCHWWAMRDDNYMVSFNLSTEMFSTTLLPLDMQDRYHDEWVDMGRRYLDLVVLNGFVAMILKHVKTAAFHIYVLGEPGHRESWTKLFIVGPLPNVWRPLGAGKKGVFQAAAVADLHVGFPKLLRPVDGCGGRFQLNDYPVCPSATPCVGGYIWFWARKGWFQRYGDASMLLIYVAVIVADFRLLWNPRHSYD